MVPREPILKGAIKLFAVECMEVRDGKLGLCLSLSPERGKGGGSDDIPWDMICVYFPNEMVKFLSCSFAKATTIRMSVS